MAIFLLYGSFSFSVKKIYRSLRPFPFLLLLFSFFGCQSLKLPPPSSEPIPQKPTENQVKIALVLGGGGAKGLAHLGVLRELEDAGIYPDLIVGCSSGALIGALYASYPSSKHWEQILINLKRSDLLDFSFFSLKLGLVKGASLTLFLKKHLLVSTFKELSIPLVVVTTDLSTGERIEIGGGELIPALKASAAIPGIFPPVSYLGRILVDGGVVDPIPVEVAKKHNAQNIIAVDVGEMLSKNSLMHSFNIVKRGFHITHRQLSSLTMRNADIILRMNFCEFGMFNDQFNREVYEQGRQVAKSYLPEIKKLLQKECSSDNSLLEPSWLFL